MDTLDAATFDALVLTRRDVPEHIAELAARSHCLYVGRLFDPDASFVVDLEIEPEVVDFSDDFTFERLSQYNLWLKEAAVEHLRSPRVLLNVGVRH